MTPFAAIDFETAGYDPASACSLGIVAANEDGSVTEWHRLIRPPVMRFAPGCIAIHGIRPEDVEDMMKTQRQRLHAFRVHRTKQDYALCGELL